MEHISGMYYPPKESFASLDREEQIRQYIKSFKEPALEVCSQLKEHFIAGRYCAILGIDTSGRLPALLVHRFSKSLTTKYGLASVPCHFIPPHMNTKREHELVEILNERAPGTYTLVVDDTIMKGRALLSATEVFRDVGIPFDVAVFISYINNKEQLAHEAEYMEADKVFVGMEDYLSSGVHDDGPEKYPIKISSVNGVERLKGPLHFGEKETVILSNEDLQDEVNIARTSLFELADEIAEELLS